MTGHEHYLCEAIELAHANVKSGGRPFGAVVVKDGEVIATGVNEVISTNDPTAHAELTAIRAATRKTNSPSLAGCSVYASGNPCPMCMAAMRMADVNEVYFAYSNAEAEPYGLSTAAVYADLAKPFSEQSMTIRHIPARLESGVDLYGEWKKLQDKTQTKNPSGR
jgi:tRNA(Arg) A34 adenosine deaminase TadA